MIVMPDIKYIFTHTNFNLHHSIEEECFQSHSRLSSIENVIERKGNEDC